MRSKKIFRNTLVLYARQIVILFVNLYAVRVLLNVLGVNDYGIFSVVAGIVTLCSFLPATMASATQRFFSYALGQNNHEALKKTFTVNWVLYAIIALAALVVLEGIGLWFVNEHLRVPAERFESARMLYHLTILAFIVGIFSSPFMAIMIAHEDMQIYAYISICEAVLKLGVVLVLVYLPWDTLEAYGALLVGVALINTILYMSVCLCKYPECQFKRFYWDKTLLREVLGFTGWTLFGQMTTVARNQAVTILLNQMFSPGVVAARAIASTVSNQVSVFASNFNTGLYPPIVKSYAVNDKPEMFSLIFSGSKLTFFLMWVFALPMFLEMEKILGFWLGTPPPDAVFFTRLALVEALIMALALPIATAARAPGRMKVYELTLGTIQLLILLVSWLVLRMGYAPYTVFVVAILANLLMFFVRLLLVKYLIGLSLSMFFMRVVVPVLGVIFFSLAFSLPVYMHVPCDFWGLVMTCTASVMATSVGMYYIGLEKSWRIKIRKMISEKITKLGFLS